MKQAQAKFRPAELLMCRIGAVMLRANHYR
jgi:hypothetical protein